MQGKQINVGGRYEVKVSDRIAVVRVLGTRERNVLRRSRGGVYTREGFTQTTATAWDCVNEATGRRIVVKSAQRFRRAVEAQRAEKVATRQHVPEAFEGETRCSGPCEEDDPCSVHCGRGPLAYDEATNPSNGWETPQASATEQEQRDGFWIVLFDAAAPGDRLPTFDSREAAVAAIKSAEQATDGNVSGRAVRFADAWDAAQAGNLS